MPVDAPRDAAGKNYWKALHLNIKQNGWDIGPTIHWSIGGIKYLSSLRDLGN